MLKFKLNSNVRNFERSVVSNSVYTLSSSTGVAESCINETLI